MLFSKNKSNIDFIIVGLGNPEPRYDKTRHNAGFNAIDYISGKSQIEVKKLKHFAKIGTGVIEGKKVLLMKPQTYMNNSGEAVGDAARYYGVNPENVIVLSDDVSLDVGKLRIRRSGSAGGHNGLKSIIEHLSSENFPRIKIGVGKKPENYDLADWVLGDLDIKERNLVCERYEDLYKALCLMVNGDIEKAMQICN